MCILVYIEPTVAGGSFKLVAEKQDRQQQQQQSVCERVATAGNCHCRSSIPDSTAAGADLICATATALAVWRSGNVDQLVRRRARLVLGWVTVSVCCQQLFRLTQPLILAGAENEYRPQV